MIKAILFAWEDRLVAAFGRYALWDVLTKRPNDRDRSFIDQARLPGALLSPTLFAEHFAVLDILGHYRDDLSDDERLFPEAVMGMRCLLLMLFAYDMRLQRLFFGRHRLHDTFGTISLDTLPGLHDRGLRFMRAIRNPSRQFIADLSVAPDVPTALDMIRGMLDYLQRVWCYDADLPWPIVEEEE